MDDKNALAKNTKLDNGNVTIFSFLDYGGFGLVYKGDYVFETNVGSFKTPDKIHHQVAIKELFIHGSCNRNLQTHAIESTLQNDIWNKWKDSIYKEANKVRSIKSQYIVKYYHIFQENNTVYLVMELLNGTNLSAVANNKPISLDLFYKYFGQLCQGVMALHQANILHLDIKPENIILLDDNNIKLIDFGLSKSFTGKGQLTSYSCIGTSGCYTPYEQTLSIPQCSKQSDIYSLGATAIYLLTGNRPDYPRESYSREVMLPKGLDKNVSRIIQKCLNHNPVDRPVSVAEILESLPVNLNTTTCAVENEKYITEVIHYPTSNSSKLIVDTELKKCKGDAELNCGEKSVIPSGPQLILSGGSVPVGVHIVDKKENNAIKSLFSILKNLYFEFSSRKVNYLSLCFGLASLGLIMLIGKTTVYSESQANGTVTYGLSNPIFKRTNAIYHSLEEMVFDDKTYYLASISEDGVSADNANYLLGMIDKWGNTIIDFNYDSIFVSSDSNHNFVGYINGQPNYYSLETGKPLLERTSLFMIENPEGLKKSQKDGKVGYVDCSSNWVIKPIYDDGSIFSEGLAAVRIGEKWGYINNKGECVIEPKFDFGNPFINGYAIVTWQGEFKFRAIDRHGKFVPGRYFEISNYSDGLFYVRNNNTDYYIDNKGNKVVDCTSFNKGYLNQVSYSDFADGIAAFCIRNKFHFGYIDKQCNIIYQPEFVTVSEFYQGQALVMTNEKRIYRLDKTGSPQLLPDLDSLIVFRHPKLYCEEHLYAVRSKKTGQWGILDGLHNQIVDFVFSTPPFYVYNSADNRYFIMEFQNGPKLCVNYAGKLVLMERVKRLYQYRNNFACVKVDNSYGLINMSGVIVSDFTYTNPVVVDESNCIRYVE